MLSVANRAPASNLHSAYVPRHKRLAESGRLDSRVGAGMRHVMPGYFSALRHPPRGMENEHVGKETGFSGT